MVSSRCVLGSSTGIRLVSARTKINRLTTTRSNGADTPLHVSEGAELSIVDNVKDDVRLASTINPKNSAGSARQAKVTSRAAPMPSKEEPVSSAANTVKKRPSPNRYANNTRSPMNATGALWYPSGIKQPAMIVVTTATTGPARNSQVVVVLSTTSLRINLKRS